MTRPPTAPAAVSALDPGVGLIVHSHLRWDFVWQRPQQILSRIARSNPVLFVEEPTFLDDVESAGLELSRPHEGVFRAVPRLPRQLAADYDEAAVVIRSLVADTLGRPPLAGHFDRTVQWFYTPMAAPAMLGAFDEQGVVYDCMDELAKFRFAPSDIGRRERLLLSRADVVFTGGYRLYESKSRYHDNVHFFGCGVDAHHFAAARRADTEVPDDAAAIAGPVLGYFGVIDERLDYDLIRTLARRRRDCTILMIGPAVKVDPRELPREENIVWLGQRGYDELPAYVKRFDVCLMPFALNEATEYINPTKTLEYMAAGRPIVSTAVDDVVRNFGGMVQVARGTDEFVQAVNSALKHPDQARIRAGIERAAESSWDSIVLRMRELMAGAIATSRAGREFDEVLGAITPLPTRAAGGRSRSAEVAASLDLAPEPGVEAP